MVKKPNGWKIRAVQLDLARQLETVDFICRFTDFIAEYGYNTLVLYLEGKIRTESFPYPPENDSYAPEHMREVVGYAQRKGVDVIPVVSTLGHSELFLEYQELSHLGELREGKHGRFSDSRNTFCPSLKETYEFLEQYLREIAEIFPSKYMHVGCDEVWDLGICSLCSERSEGQSGIFAKHLIDIHQITAKKLGKKMIMWDDMFELYPEALEIIPRDIIMCCWQYDSLVDIPRAHFMNCYREDAFAKYDRVGFDYLFAPRETNARNGKTFTQYAARYNALGGLLTTWGKSTKFLYESYPIIGFIGKLWDEGKLEKADGIFDDCIKEIFGLDDPLFINAVRTLKSIEHWPEGTKAEAFLRGPVTELEYERKNLLGVLADTLEVYRKKVKTPLGRDVLEDILIYVKREMLQHELRRIIPGLYAVGRTHRNSEKRLQRELKQSIVKIQEIGTARKDQWERYRSGIRPCHAKNFYKDFQNNMGSLLDEIKEAGLLNVYYFLPERYSAQKVALFIKYEGAKDWQKLTEGVYKPICDQETFYCVSYPIPYTKIPKAIRIETRGYGGQGFTFVEVVSSAGHFVPAEIRNVEGEVLNPEHFLVDDLKWCFMGEKNTKRACLDPDLAEACHCIEVILGGDKRSVNP